MGDHQAFIDTLIDGHRAWLVGHESSDRRLTATGAEFFDHYVGDADHPTGLLFQYEAWRARFGYTRIRPWNGSEMLGRTPTALLPSPGLVVSFVRSGFVVPPGPALDPRLAEGRTTAQLQAEFGTGATGEGRLGDAIVAHWNLVHGYVYEGNAGFNIGNEMANNDSAIYSVRLWSFMKWASQMRSRLRGIPVFAIPIAYDADGVPLSDIDFIDSFNRWHVYWHGDEPGHMRADVITACSVHTAEATNNPFAPPTSPFGQSCGRIGESEEFLRFHRDLLDTYDAWRRRAGMPAITRWPPPLLHFHEDEINGTPLDQVDIDRVDQVIQRQQILDRVRHYNSLSTLAAFCEGPLHALGHSAPTSDDIGPPDANNYSPRFMGWHRWVDFLWELRAPNFEAVETVAGGVVYPRILTVVRPTGNPADDRIEPVAALSARSNGRGSLSIRIRVRPDPWARRLNLTGQVEVFRASSDSAAVITTTLTPIDDVPQGTDHGPLEVSIDGLDGDGEGAFAVRDSGGVVAFKNGRIRITLSLTVAPGQTIPGSLATGVDSFQHDRHVDVFLVQDRDAPIVTAILNKSSFSTDEVSLNAGMSDSSRFEEAFFVVVEDPTPPPASFDPANIFSDPARAIVAGIFMDATHPPGITMVDDAGGAEIDWAHVEVAVPYAERPGLHPNAPQRILFPCHARFDVPTMAAALPAGSRRHARLRMTARDRAGNVALDVLSERIKLFTSANPYMIDVRGQNPAWLSDDTRVFSVRHTQMLFGTSVQMAGSPQLFIQEVMSRLSRGLADFDDLPAGQEQSPLELAPRVGGEDVFNFALARLRAQTLSRTTEVRVFFRLFTTAVSNLSFTRENYPTDGSPPIALLGTTGDGGEILSVPFFAEERIDTRDSATPRRPMDMQPDTPNGQTFDPSPPGAPTVRYFGAVLDINSNVPRYPAAPRGRGPFPTAECVSIRDLLRGQHQCMVAEIHYPPDPTEDAANPGTSDNLAQRNLLILEAANPGDPITRTIQHSFDLAAPSPSELQRLSGTIQDAWTRNRLNKLTHPEAATSATARVPSAALRWLARWREISALAVKAHGKTAIRDAGLDELVIRWNNLPHASVAEIHLPSIDVEYVRFLREMRRAPPTVRPRDEHTLLLDVGGVTFLPIPNVGLERLNGLITLTLPEGIKAGEVYSVDVLQVRGVSGEVLGGFRLSIPVKKAADIYAREARVLETFERRLQLTPTSSRWRRILERQVDYLRARLLGLAHESV
jgi:hypothetical protein